MSEQKPIALPGKRGAALPQGPAQLRIGKPMRLAFKLRVEEGLTIKEACARAGVSEAGWHKAMTKPAARDLYERIELQFIQTIERRRATYKARAIEVAADLMERGQSEAVRMRAVEFFAGESKQALVNITLPGTEPPATGYRYTRPDRGASDSQSGADDAQVIDGTAQSPDDHDNQ
jgi:hypothetical protein